MADLFSSTPSQTTTYTAEDIEVLEGLEPVRHRPGMYIGGTDQSALHHLVAELVDNSMDEAVAGHATRIGVELLSSGAIRISDNGRGIPVDQHPKYKKLSALEVILTTLHSGGKFRNKAYETSGGLHGVGLSVVNALSSELIVEVARDKVLWRQTYSQGKPQTKLENMGAVANRRGTAITFSPDPVIFKETTTFSPAVLYRMVRSKAYLYKGVEVRWSCDADLLTDKMKVPTEERLCFANGLADYLTDALKDQTPIIQDIFSDQAIFSDKNGRMEWAITWVDHDLDIPFKSYCNTIPTPQGGGHENGFRSALTRSLKEYGDMVGNKRAAQITPDDVMMDMFGIMSVFIREPQFQGQTKEKLVTSGVNRWVENAVKDLFDHWLTANPTQAKQLIDHIIERMDERLRRKKSREAARKTATQRMRLPGKLTDCSSTNIEDTEIFFVEGESAGGSAKSARNRKTQAILPLRGKVLNVANASADKLMANQMMQDVGVALGTGMGKSFDLDKLRYGKVIIMTDADVDGAHIAALLMTFFFQQMRPLIDAGRLYLAQPPLYRLVHGSTSVYASDEAHKEILLKTTFKGKTKIEMSRFKGLGEMLWKQLRDTTMDPGKRTLLRVSINKELDETDDKPISEFVDDLMGRNPEKRFQFISENASFVKNLDV